MINIVTAGILLALSLAAHAAQTSEPSTSAWDNAYGGADKSYDRQLLALREQVAPTFTQKQFVDPVTNRSMAYNLYLPPQYDPHQRYPLVMFMADASTTGKGVMAPLKQGYGGIIWATPESQAKHPCIVLVPSYDGPDNAVNDAWAISDEVPTTLHLLKHIIGRYNIDRQRVYTTGQSMGGMISFYLNANYPDLFAASLFVGSQWDIQVLSPLARQHFLYIVSAGDDKASNGMRQVGQMLDAKGVSYGQTHFSARLPQAQQDVATQALLAKGRAINFIQFDAGTVPPVGSTHPGGEHMYSFDHAYLLTPAREWLLQQVRQDGVVALYNQGLDAKDKRAAFAYFMQAAQQGDGLSAYQVGRAYAQGIGVTPSSSQAIDWYQKAIQQGVDSAMLDLGLIYFNGDGVKQDYAQAKTLFSLASQHNQMKAPRYLGILYEEGLGVKPDYALARQYYQAASDLGDITAAARLGWMYERGLGVAKSDAEALKWYRIAAPSAEEAASNIHPRVLALLKLGQFYEQGRVVQPDRQQALIWYRLAAQDQDPAALAALDRLKE
ncbi:MAG: alpha/beta hydrolase-fold protein [Aeromonadaceae bacterium]